METVFGVTKQLERKLTNLIITSTYEAMKSNVNLLKEWLSLSEAAIYAGVSYNTFLKFRQRGLRVCEIEGIKRVSRKEIDRFLEENSF